MKAVTPSSLTIDPHALLAPGQAKPFRSVLKAHREAIVAVIAIWMREHADKIRPAGALGSRFPLWEDVRYQPIDAAGTTVEQVLSTGEIPSPAEALGDVAALLWGLRDRRAALERELAQLSAFEDFLSGKGR